MNKLISSVTIALLTLAQLSGCGVQQNAGKSTDYEALLDEKRYTFVARSIIPTEDSRFNPRLMHPQGNQLYQLTSRYDIVITPDTVKAFLPFFGRSFTAPIDPTKGGINFTSVQFDYKEDVRKKNRHITIIPKDARDIRSVTLVISPAGYASAQVLSMNRTPVSFNGVIEAAK